MKETVNIPSEWKYPRTRLLSLFGIANDFTGSARMRWVWESLEQVEKKLIHEAGFFQIDFGPGGGDIQIGIFDYADAKDKTDAQPVVQVMLKGLDIALRSTDPRYFIEKVHFGPQLAWILTGSEGDVKPEAETDKSSPIIRPERDLIHMPGDRAGIALLLLREGLARIKREEPPHLSEVFNQVITGAYPLPEDIANLFPTMPGRRILGPSSLPGSPKPGN